MSLESKESYQLKPSAKPPSNLVQTIERVNLLMDILSRTPQGLSPGEVRGGDRGRCATAERCG